MKRQLKQQYLLLVPVTVNQMAIFNKSLGLTDTNRDCFGTAYSRLCTSQMQEPMTLEKMDSIF